jgi:hypothetical protein
LSLLRLSLLSGERCAVSVPNKCICNYEAPNGGSCYGPL